MHEEILSQFLSEDDTPPLGRELSGSSQGSGTSGGLQAPYLMNADALWDRSYSGENIKVAIFDTGLGENHPHFRNVRLRTDWTDEENLDDILGHGTFVTGVIASNDEECPGFAPDADLFIFRVFTKERVSYTSWFLDAFNYAIHLGIDVLNLSIGGPDFMDLPFIEKVWEMSANNIIVISAIGNDGPVYGTLNNPADQLDVIGVGGIQFNELVSQFSSRGMTTWELPRGYGRVKPDIVAYAQTVSGSRSTSGCRTLSGTSVASPVVAGVVTLLASSVDADERHRIVNPASMKQALIEGSDRVVANNIYEQGLGKVNLLRSFEILQNYSPRASFVPSTLDLTDCPYMWPFCTQPIYATGMPVQFNVTIMNGLGVSGEIEGTPEWIGGVNGEHLEISFQYEEVLWPWSGYLGIILRVRQGSEGFSGIAEGMIRLTVTSDSLADASADQDVLRSTIELPVRVSVIETPPREKRVLWDQYHSLRYPSGYFPRDALWVKNEPFDWNADHLHTNFKGLYDHLRHLGYYVEILGEPFTCFDAKNYGTLLLVDPEEEYHEEEETKLFEDVTEKGLSLVVFADWYDLDVMAKINFFDENTRQWWEPVTGGSNIPALNSLLNQFGIAFGGRVFDGNIGLGKNFAHFASGVGLSRFPGGGDQESLIYAFELSDQSAEIVGQLPGKRTNAAILGLTRPLNGKGRIAAFGDSSCLDDAHQDLPCYWLLGDLLQYSSEGVIPEPYKQKYMSRPYVSSSLPVPKYPQNNALASFSKVIGYHPFCSTLDFISWSNGTSSTPRLNISWPTPNISKGPPDGEVVNVPRHTQSDVNENGPSIGMALLPWLVVCVVLIILVGMLRRKRDGRKTGKNVPV
eukprot:CAMPEP_0201477864 /NCGR_PEP_ID=MMETSP0151_2-20130828/2812_1 /ASSEMBLY_ACC=CAM_ASM_000257 /TAXON_ID=200890 /ORGANISM="Paramoeba atlantica, Strain 621/1 / CCAP 1560/9" /LENGTH=858 /DNA_ID=CAMNT_0047858729 /DNA_START=531 /DNA_END=3107 /DNA_ORIENTATION=-